MELRDKVAIVTGGGRGIGAALARRFQAEGAAGIVVADLDEAAATAVAEQVGGIAMVCDVSSEVDIQNLVKAAETHYGPVDLFCSNAGLGFGDAGPLAASLPNDKWELLWQVHVMSHVYAARAVLPSMLERGSGYLLNTASAAGLLSQVGDAAYSATKHAAVGFAESLAIRHGDQGIKVSVLCPQYVATAIIGRDGQHSDLPPGVISVDELADCTVQGLRDERFLILPHPQVLDYHQKKTADYDRWIAVMQQLKSAAVDDDGNIDFELIHQLIGGAAK